MNILYLEDNQMDAELVKRYVSTTHHNLDIVESIEAADSLCDDSTDLLLIDLLIDNERSSLEFIKRLREEGFNKQIIAVTALSSEQDVESCRQAGCNAILIKPYNITQLAEIINH